MVVAVTFWMDGAEDFQAELKVRRKTDFSTFDVNPIMNLDPFGDQENHRWITYLATLDGLTPGQSFNVILEGSLGGHPNNSVAVDMVEIRGVREAALDHSSFFDFENGLQGWSSGNLEGGRWLLQTWSELDPSVGVPRPSDGENFLFVDRFDIHSGKAPRPLADAGLSYTTRYVSHKSLSHETGIVLFYRVVILLGLLHFSRHSLDGVGYLGHSPVAPNMRGNESKVVEWKELCQDKGASEDLFCTRNILLQKKGCIEWLDITLKTYILIKYLSCFSPYFFL
ncbi:uncharacterized protein LOC134774462 [Penaeus indicus]|uniref:uncharacterized protein LOC134774462 n=1 Tax=Penaeus indicus TaxID=29960 RepID=UPI00300C1388